MKKVEPFGSTFFDSVLVIRYPLDVIIRKFLHHR